MLERCRVLVVTRLPQHCGVGAFLLQLDKHGLAGMQVGLVLACCRYDSVVIADKLVSMM